MALSRACLIPALLGLVLAGCAGTNRSGTPAGGEVIFTPPSAAPAGADTRTVQGAPPLILDLVGSQLEAQGFTISHFDLDGGEMVAEYRGDAAPYVDCGWIVQLDPATGNTRQYPAASPSLTLDDGTTRELELIARLFVRAFTEQDSHRLRGEVTYVLIESVRAPGALEAEKAIMQFRSGETEAFSNGAQCRPTGELERLPGRLVPTT